MFSPKSHEKLVVAVVTIGSTASNSPVIMSFIPKIVYIIQTMKKDKYIIQAMNLVIYSRSKRIETITKKKEDK